MQKVNWKQRLVQAAWLLAGIGTVVLLGAAMQQKNRKKCTDIRIEITGAEQHMFIDEKDIMDMLQRNGPVTGTPVAALNLRAMETVIEKDPWVKNAEMFFDNQQVLQVRIEERQPVARVFTIQGHSFYLDSGAMRLPLSEKLSARVPMFTNFPSDRKLLSKPDSTLLRNVVKLGGYILADSFWMAQVAQVDITPQANFELVPVMGDHVVSLGNTDELDDKFNRLYTFYKQAWLQNGMNTYDRLDLRFNSQVVARKRSAAQSLAATATAATPDKDSAAIVAKPTPVVKPLIKEPVKTKTINAANNKINNNSLTKKRAANVKQPKAVMKSLTKKTTNN